MKTATGTQGPPPSAMSREQGEGGVRGLSPQQWAVVAAPVAPCVVLAGAGAGKTMALVARVSRLLDEGHPPEFMLVVTFTRRAAGEMRARLGALGHERLPEVRTLHSWCASFLRPRAALIDRTRHFTIYDPQDIADLEALATDARGGRDLYCELMAEGDALAYDDLEARARGLLRRLTAADDDPLRGHLRERFEPYRHVLVDEAQDLSAGQWDLLGYLSSATMAVGDLRQAIYQFRGGRSDLLRALPWPVRRLDENYRSGGEIVALANRVWSDEPPMRTARWAGSAALTSRTETPTPAAVLLVRALHLNDPGGEGVAVLASTWRELRDLAQALREAGVPCSLPADDPWAAPDGRALSRALRLARNPSDGNLVLLLGRHAGVPIEDLVRWRALSLAQRRPVLDAAAVLGDARWDQLRDAVRGARDLPAHRLGVEVARVLRLEVQHLVDGLLVDGRTVVEHVDWMETEREEPLEFGPGVRMLTIHGAKGLEWPAVVVLGVGAQHFGASEERRNALYVAVTRARDVLVLVCPTLTPGGKPATPSPWLPADDPSPSEER